MDDSTHQPSPLMPAPLPRKQAPAARKPTVAPFLKDRIDFADAMRTSSAPPGEVPASGDVVDPAYAAFYHANKSVDTRLPPPNFAPGQSWQAWSGRPALETKPSWDSTPTKKSLVEMIQEDFPRTPSPALSAYQNRRNVLESPMLRGADDLIADALKNARLEEDDKENTAPKSTKSVASTFSSPKADFKLPSAVRKDMFSNWDELLSPGHVLEMQRSQSVAPVKSKSSHLINDIQRPYTPQVSSLFGGDPLFAPPARANVATPPPPGYGRPLAPQTGRASPRPLASQTGRASPRPKRPESPAPKIKSALLDDFKANKRRLELRDIAGHVVEFSCDQHGSRFIQQKLETAFAEDKQALFSELLPRALALMTDVFGNYVIQKMFEFGTVAQRTHLAKIIKGSVMDLSMQMYGCRVIQKAIEFSPADYQLAVLEELKGHVLPLVKDQNGNHVIQKCIEKVNAARIAFILEAFRDQAYTLATHPYGCRVIQRIFEHCNEEQIAPVLKEITRHAVGLAQDQYGNYVIQHILEKGSYSDRKTIIDRLVYDIAAFSRHKFASNVAEKCIIFGTTEQQRRILDTVTNGRNDASSPLFMMMKDQFANYVVQKMIDYFREPLKSDLLHRIEPLLPMLRKFSYGKHIVIKVERLLS